MKKLLTLIFFAGASVVFFIYLQKNLGYNYKRPNIEELVKAKVKNHYLDKKIQEAIRDKNFDEVEVYTNLARDFNITLLPQTKELIAKENTLTKKILRGTTNFVNGFIKGEAKNGAQMAGAITSDLTLYGDLRDITIEGKKYIEDKPYDKLILGLSLAGATLSATTFVTLGSSSSLKVGASTLKLAKREKYLTKSFSKSLSNLINKSIDYKALRSIKFTSIAELKQSPKIIKNSINLKPLKPIFKEIKTIKNSTSIADTVHLMKYVDNSSDLKALAKLSKRYKGSTRGILKLFGKNIFRTLKVTIKWTTPLLISIVGLIVSILGFIYVLFSKVE